MPTKATKSQLKKILFIVPYPAGCAPSQRFRFEQYLETLKSANYTYKLAPFWPKAGWEILYREGFVLEKTSMLILGFLKRIMHLLQALNYDYIFLHREALPLGPPVIEFVISKLWRKKIIYDFDDAIWMENTSSQNRIAAYFKWHHKVKSICRWSWKISVGNGFLADFARQYNQKVIINPTTIDTGYHVPLNKQSDQVVIGWTGTHSTAKYLNLVGDVLTQLRNKFDFKVLIISNQRPAWDFDDFEFIQWSPDQEIENLGQIDIGLMPLEDSIWEQGKCGFKALQYMALEIPAVVSAVGVNIKIVDHGKNGYLCSNPAEWKESITKLLESADLRKKMGRDGRNKVLENYSVSSNKDLFLSIFA